METLNLASTSGIVAATMFIVEILKRVLTGYKWFDRLPVFFYSIFIAGILGLLANKVVTDTAGEPLLKGATWQVVWNCIGAAASASGFYTWLRNPEAMKTAAKNLCVLFFLFIGAGCHCPEKAVLREGIDQTISPILDEHKEWTEKAAAGEPLPRLTPADVQNRMMTHDEYEKLIQEDRNRE